jgi:hypothetical protein
MYMHQLVAAVIFLLPFHPFEEVLVWGVFFVW